VLLVLLDHLQLLLVRSHYLFQPVLQQRLRIDGLRLVVLLEFEGFSVPLIVHVLLF
jgi:hypothetical protein